jgi:hypothetical protein
MSRSWISSSRILKAPNVCERLVVASSGADEPLSKMSIASHLVSSGSQPAFAFTFALFASVSSY